MTHSEFLHKLFKFLAYKHKKFSPEFITTLSIEWGIRYIFTLSHLTNFSQFRFHFHDGSPHFYSNILESNSHKGCGFIKHPDINSLATSIWVWRQMR